MYLQQQRDRLGIRSLVRHLLSFLTPPLLHEDSQHFRHDIVDRSSGADDSPCSSRPPRGGRRRGGQRRRGTRAATSLPSPHRASRCGRDHCPRRGGSGRRGRALGALLRALRVVASLQLFLALFPVFLFVATVVPPTLLAAAAVAVIVPSSSSSSSSPSLMVSSWVREMRLRGAVCRSLSRTYAGAGSRALCAWR